jgi:hypothetical protein
MGGFCKTEGGYEIEKVQKEAFAVAKASWLGSLILLEQILANQRLHQLVPVNLADHAPGVVVIGDIGGVFGQKITYDLIDGVVTLLAQGIEHTPENSAHILFVVAGYGKLQGFTIRHGLSLLKLKIHRYYSPKLAMCKALF